MSSWSARTVAVMGTSALVMTAFAGSALAGTPAAAPPQSHAEAQFLSGSLFNGFLPFDNLLALRGASATNTGQSSAVVQRNNELVTLFGFPIINNPHGTPIDPASAIQGGFADQYAQASPGTAVAASGALSDSGVFGDNHSTSFPADATIDLSKMMGAGAFSGLQDATLKLSAISSEAAVTAGTVPAKTCAHNDTPTNCLDYSAAAGTLSFTSPQLAAIPASVGAALAPIDAQAAQLQSAIAVAVKGLDLANGTLNGLLELTAGSSHLNVSVNLGLVQAVVDALKTPIASGGVTLDPSTGKVTIDVGSFVKLNNRAPDTTLTNGEQLYDISPAIPALTTAISQRITDAAAAALAASSVTVHYDASAGIAPLVSSLNIDLQGSLLTVANGKSQASITGQILGVPAGTPSADLLRTPLKALAAPVVGAINTAAQTLAANVAAGVGASLNDQVKPATLSFPDFVTMKVNVQSQPSPGIYQVTALQVAINGPFGNFATINLATSRAGTNTAAVSTAAAGQAGQAALATPVAGPSPTTADPHGGTTAVANPTGAPTSVATTTGVQADRTRAQAPHTSSPATGTPGVATAPAAATAGNPQATVDTDVVNKANTGDLTEQGSQTQWFALVLLLITLSLTSAGLVVRRR